MVGFSICRRWARHYLKVRHTFNPLIKFGDFKCNIKKLSTLQIGKTSRIKLLSTFLSVKYFVNLQVIDDRTRAQPIYQSLKKNPPKNVGQLCSCINDVQETGIADQLINVANYLKTFGKTSRIFIFGSYNFGKYFGESEKTGDCNFEKISFIFSHIWNMV